MPPKKAKKGKKQDDDAKWDSIEAAIPGLEVLKDDETVFERKPTGASAFLSLNDGEEDPFAGEDMSGGLMGAIQANMSKKSKKKDRKPVSSPPLDLIPADDAVSNSYVTNEELPEKTVDELADEEWALPLKSKKKAQKVKVEHQVDEEVSQSGPVLSPPPMIAEAEVDEEAESSNKLLSKKEKEKLKKERDKAKKKVQAEAKKAEEEAFNTMLSTNERSKESVAPPVPAPTSITPPPAPPPLEEDEGDEEGVAKSDKKKKKKKKPAAKEESKPEPVKKKTGGAVAALRALREQQLAAEEEARKQEEEELRRIEEEEKRAAEEERLAEEAKQKRKEKEKAKREQARLEGRLLTDKQKKAKAQAEIARKALIASGARIEGLEQPASPTIGAKRVVYGNKKKKALTTSSEQAHLPAESQPTTSSTSTPIIKAVDSLVATASSNTKDVLDARAAVDVKDDWEASSEEDNEEPSVREVQSSSSTVQVSVAKLQPVVKSPKDTASTLPSALISTSHESDSESTADDVSQSQSSSESESDDEDDSSDNEDLTTVQRQAAIRKAEAAERRLQRHKEAMAARSKDNLRSPICCILGHVDTGKTKLLDKIRQTNVQEGEAGGITQQIGATYFPVDALKEKTLVLNKNELQEYKIPGLLVIDTPGHESFTNLRTRGSSLCNIAVLVVDIMHGLEPQTIESLRLLRDRKTPFVVALNKIDRLYGWVPTPDGAFQESLAKQVPSVQREFAQRYEKTVVAFAEQGLNAVLYYDNKNMSKNVSLVPTSAVTGEGVPDMIMLLVNLTQTRMSDSLMYLSELQCTVLEVKIIEGLGTTIDVVLSNGILQEGDKIVLCGLNGPIVTQIRALLTPQPMRELRIKSAYVHHKEVKAALGVKITAPDLEKAIAGSRLLVLGPDDDEDDLREEVMSDLTDLLNSVDRSGRGVSVQASTLGSLEALLDFLKVSKIPVASIGIGPVHKRDIMQAATMIEKAKEMACVLCFDVTVDKDAERIADEYGIRIFKADIIYHLFDAFTAYNAEIVEAKRRDAAPQAIWPCRLKIIAVITKRDPIILGVDILDGTLRVGTPLCVVKVDATSGKREVVSLGKITSLEINHKSMDVVKKSQAGGGVAIKIEHAVHQSSKMYGRHFDDKDDILSHINRQSIDVMKESFRKDVTMEEWALIKALKQHLDIQ